MREVDRRDAELRRERLRDVVFGDVAELDERLPELHPGGLHLLERLLELLVRDELRLDEEIPELHGHAVILASQGAPARSLLWAPLSGDPGRLVPATTFRRRAVTEPIGITVLAMTGRCRASSENQRKSLPRFRSSAVSFSRSCGWTLNASNTPASVSTVSFSRIEALSL